MILIEHRAIGHVYDMGHMSDGSSNDGGTAMPENTRDYLTLGLLLLVVVASGLDIAADFGHGAPLGHLVQEGLVMAAALGMLLWILHDLRQRARQIEWLEEELATVREQPTPPIPELEQARQQLGEAVDLQFQTWGLTDSEKAIGWLLLKGLSIKEIAGLRATHEKTVRQQASSIYHKADLPGRHAFVAWFIEDLL